MSHDATHILIADRQLLFRQSLAVALHGDGWSVISEIGDEHGLEQALTNAADVLVIDHAFVPIDIIAFCQTTTSRLPRLRIMVLTNYEREASTIRTRAIQNGAAACLSKELTADTYLLAVRLLAAGYAFVPLATLRQALREHTATPVAVPRTHPGLSNLTIRELEVVALASQGHSNQEIAKELSITENTVIKHMSHVMRKLEAQSRGHAGEIYRRAQAARADENGA